MDQINPVDPAEAPGKNRLPLPVFILAGVLLVAFLGFLYMGLQRSQQGPVQVGDSMPPIILTTFDGQMIDTSEQKGNVVLLNFWASWCKPCESESAALQSAWEYYQPGGQVLFVGVDYVDTEPEALASLQKYGITFPNGPDLGTKISQMFRIRGVPETYIIDRNGNLAYIQIGPFSSSEQIKSIIDPLLQ
jgi:cytochrome c biogenesis protein CcmG/thiol:disulfide interchange protein DsbE